MEYGDIIREKVDDPTQRNEAKVLRSRQLGNEIKLTNKTQLKVTRDMGLSNLVQDIQGKFTQV